MLVAVALCYRSEMEAKTSDPSADEALTGVRAPERNGLGAVYREQPLRRAIAGMGVLNHVYFMSRLLMLSSSFSVLPLHMD